MSEKLLNFATFYHSLFFILVILAPYPISEEGKKSNLVSYTSMLWILVKNMVCLSMTSTVSKVEVAGHLKAAKYLKLSPRRTKNIIMLASVLISCQTMHGIAKEWLDIDMIAGVVGF